MVNRPSVAGQYVLDSHALIAYLEAEPGSHRILELLTAARAGKCILLMCVVNLGEVMYLIERERGLHQAQNTLARIDELPVEIIDADLSLTLAAAHLKMDCPIAYADCLAAALAQQHNAILLTGDPEFNKIKAERNVHIEWMASQTE